jgi:hypothetical protein
MVAKDFPTEPPSRLSRTLCVMDKGQFRRFALAAAPKAAAVANYCDHVEHNESAETSWVTEAAAGLSRLAFELAHTAGVDLLELYAERLGAIEARNVLAHPGGFDGHAAALAASSWRDLQLVQIEHDRSYHADVIGLAKVEQLRHYALHLAKIVGAFAEAADHDELINRRLPDVLLFAMKLQTVMGKRLSDEPLPQHRRSGQLLKRH